MCGIIAIANKNQAAKQDIVFGLKALEYRGYDSAGAIFARNFEVYKTIDSIETLEKMISKTTDTIGIGHTRWATHGAICLENAHPIIIGNASIVHNGIIENAEKLKAEFNLKTKGQTDTEVLLALFIFLLKKNNNDTLKTLEEIKVLTIGSYACAFLFAHSNKIFFAKKGLSPLICAQNEHGCLIASDELAISKDSTIFDLSQDCYGFITPDTFEIIQNDPIKQHSIKGNVLVKPNQDKTFLEIEIESQKEIFLEESKLEPLKNKYDLKKYDSILLIGCGSAYIAATIGAIWLEEHGINAHAEIASEWNSRKIAKQSNTLAIFISQSGETADTLSALRIAKSLNMQTLAIINKETSTIAKEAHEYIHLNIGQEQSVASSKAFTAQLLKLFSLTFGSIDESVSQAIDQVINIDLAQHIDAILSFKKTIILGKNTMYSIAKEGALKINEITYLNTQAYASGELKHGYIALVDADTLVMALLPKANEHDEFEHNLYMKALSNISEIKTRSGRIMLIASQTHANADFFINMPEVQYKYSPFTYAVIMQRIALELGKKLNTSIDRPRNLAKAVTVE